MPTHRAILCHLCRPVTRTAALLVFLSLSLLPAAPGRAASPASLTNQGNKAYGTADYQKALNLYTQAAEKEKGDSAIIDYNRGNALYRLKDFDGARKAYEKAAQNQKNGKLAARSYYNMGNAAYRQAETLLQQTPDKAMTSFTESAAAYREALRMAPQLSGAGSNLELTNMRIQELAAQLQQQRQPGAGKQNKSSDQDRQEEAKNSQSLQDLADRQQQLADQTGKLQNGPQGEKEKQKAANALAEDQQHLRQKTKEQMQGKAGQKQGALDDLKSATELQQKAEEKLHAADLQQAAELQKQAAEKLQKAAENEQRKADSTKKNNGDKKEAGDRQDQKPQEQGNQTQADNRPPAEDKHAQAAAPPPELDPREILNQEKMQRQLRRQRMISSGERQVEKDW